MTRFVLEKRVGADARILAVHGELDVRHVVDADRALLDLAADPDHALIVSLARCEFIDSVGVATLLAAFRRAQARGDTSMAIACPSGSEARDRLRRAGLDRLIPTFDSVDDAIFAANTPPPAMRPTDVFQPGQSL